MNHPNLAPSVLMSFLPIIVFSSLFLVFSRHTLFSPVSPAPEKEKTDGKKFGAIELTESEVAAAIAVYIKDKINQKSDT